MTLPIFGELFTAGSWVAHGGKKHVRLGEAPKGTAKAACGPHIGLWEAHAILDKTEAILTHEACG